MVKQKTQSLKTRTIGLCLIVFLTFTATVLLQETFAQSNNTASTNWNLNMTMQANNGTKININQNPTFAPFDLIQLTANLTKGNLTAPNTPVVFKVKGPISASYPTEIVRSSTTDNTSLANMTFRIPLETNEENVQGTWQIFANANTINGILQQNATFQVAWPIQVNLVNLLNSKNQNQKVFLPGDLAKASLKLNSKQEQLGNLTLNVLDADNNVINQTQMQNISFNASKTNQVTVEFKIPKDAEVGAAILNLAIFSGNYQGMAIPAGQNTTANFAISNNTVPILAPTPNPTPTPLLENSISLFSWILVATGLFTFTALIMFLKRKPMSKINNQIPITQESSSSQTIMTQTSQPSEQQLSSLTQVPSIYETLNISTPESSSLQDQKQLIINQLTKISSG